MHDFSIHVLLLSAKTFPPIETSGRPGPWRRDRGWSEG